MTFTNIVNTFKYVTDILCIIYSCTCQ